MKVAAAYPGTPSSEILKDVADNYPEIYAEWSPNEMVAVQVAAGAALAGARAMASMKHVGMNVASDALMTLAYTGIKGGLMIVVADDPNVHSSQNEQDSRNWARFGKVPMLEPGDAQECYEFTKASFDISEKFDTPVLLRTVTRIAHADSLVQTGKRVESKMPLGLDPKEAPKYVMVPAHVRPRRKAVEERMRKLEAFADKTKLNKMEINSKSVGIIASGSAYMYAKEVFPEYSFLKLGMGWPLPKKMIADFFKQVKKVMIIEELDPFFETEIKAMGYKIFHGKDIIPNMYELSPEIVEQAVKGKAYKAPKVRVKPEDLPRRPPNLCAGCSHRPLFYALKKLGAFVFGDIGCYTLAVAPPISALHTTICMGAGGGMVHGAMKAMGKDALGKMVAVLGDSTFLHSGLAPLMNAGYNKGNSTTIVLDNRITGMRATRNTRGRVSPSAANWRTRSTMPDRQGPGDQEHPLRRPLQHQGNDGGRQGRDEQGRSIPHSLQGQPLHASSQGEASGKVQESSLCRQHGQVPRLQDVPRDQLSRDKLAGRRRPDKGRAEEKGHGLYQP